MDHPLAWPSQAGPKELPGLPPMLIQVRPKTNQTQEAWVYSHDGPIRCRNPYDRARHGDFRVDH
eukprot:5852615-Pyramimonas_sp.AAC.1